MASIDHLLQKRLLLVTGKGGIGKTLVSAALAIAAVAAGKRVCIVESTAEDQLAPLCGAPSVGHKLTEARSDLFIVNLNAQENFRDFIVSHLGHGKLFEKVFTKSIVRSFIEMIPGIPELTLLGRLYYLAELCREPAFDLVILDAFASGHFLSLMTTPEAILASGLVGPIVAETEKVHQYLSDPSKTGIIVTTAAEKLAVSECLDFLPKLSTHSPAQLLAVLVNHTWQIEQTTATSPYLAQKLAHSQSALAGLLGGVKQQQNQRDDEHLPIFTLPECGAIFEPLTETFVADFFAAARVVST